MTSMHRFDRRGKRLSWRILSYALTRMRTDPPLEHAETLATLRARAGITITPAGIGGNEALRIWQEVLAPACISVDHPRFFSYVPGAPTEAAGMFDVAISAANVYAGSWQEGAGAVFAENEALAWIAGLAGFPSGAGGVFVSGGTAGNLSALIAARWQWRHRTGGAHDLLRQRGHEIGARDDGGRAPEARDRGGHAAGQAARGEQVVHEPAPTAVEADDHVAGAGVRLERGRRGRARRAADDEPPRIDSLDDEFGEVGRPGDGRQSTEIRSHRHVEHAAPALVDAGCAEVVQPDVDPGRLGPECVEDRVGERGLGLVSERDRDLPRGGRGIEFRRREHALRRAQELGDGARERPGPLRRDAPPAHAQEDRVPQGGAQSGEHAAHGRLGEIGRAHV